MRAFVYGFIVFVDCSWYPPGHGDMYQALYNSGLLEKFIKEGKEYIFSSNIDNLGATVDMCIFSRMVDKEKPRTKHFQIRHIRVSLAIIIFKKSLSRTHSEVKQ